MKTSGILVLAFVATLSYVVFASASETLAFQDGDGGAYSNTQGAYVTTLFTGGNGTGQQMYAASLYDLVMDIAYVRFPDIIGDNAGQIPVGSTIEFAKLQLTRSNASALAAEMRRVTSAWDENTVTGDNKPDLGDGVGMIPEGAVGPHAGNIKVLVQAWADGEENWGVAIWPGYSDTSIDQRFYSDDAYAQGSRPALIVTFTPPPLTATETTTWGKVKALYR